MKAEEKNIKNELNNTKPLKEKVKDEELKKTTGGNSFLLAYSPDENGTGNENVFRD